MCIVLLTSQVCVVSSRRIGLVLLNKLVLYSVLEGVIAMPAVGGCSRAFVCGFWVA